MVRERMRGRESRSSEREGERARGEGRAGERERKEIYIPARSCVVTIYN